MAYWEGLTHRLHKIDYSHVLPFSAVLPLPLGRLVSVIRGTIAAVVDYEWRNIAVGRRFVRRQTFEGMQIIDPRASLLHLLWRTWKRFVHNAREEWEACLFEWPVMTRIKKKCIFEGFEDVLAHSEQGRGIVLVSCHFDSFCMGMVLMGMHGLPVNVINTAEIENEKIVYEVRKFYQRKYRAMESLMRGRMPYYQTEMPFFYQALRRGESVAIMGDVPGSKSSVSISFLGRQLRVPLGAWQLARETKSLLVGFVCIYLGRGRYKVVCCGPQEVDADPETALRPIYAFLETWIRKMPDRWVSADLLPGYDYTDRSWDSDDSYL